MTTLLITLGLMAAAMLGFVLAAVLSVGSFADERAEHARIVEKYEKSLRYLRGQIERREAELARVLAAEHEAAKRPLNPLDDFFAYEYAMSRRARDAYEFTTSATTDTFEKKGEE